MKKLQLKGEECLARIATEFTIFVQYWWTLNKQRPNGRTSVRRKFEIDITLFARVIQVCPVFFDHPLFLIFFKKVIKMVPKYSETSEISKTVSGLLIGEKLWSWEAMMSLGHFDQNTFWPKAVLTKCFSPISSKFLKQMLCRFDKTYKTRFATTW